MIAYYQIHNHFVTMLNNPQNLPYSTIELREDLSTLNIVVFAGALDFVLRLCPIEEQELN